MSDRTFEPERALGSALASMDRQELCRFAIALCSAVREREGEAGYCGGLFPENISRDESGEIAVGPAALSDWGEAELRFVPPELYWDGECSPASDVYSLGLLLWYGLSGGKLPLEGESPDPQLSRMSGKSFPAPAGAGIRLGEIVQKACAFKAEDRYAGPEELRIVLESCLDEKYETGAELFKKEETELSEAERMMRAIIGGEPAAESGAPAETETEAATEDGPSTHPRRPRSAISKRRRRRWSRRCSASRRSPTSLKSPRRRPKPRRRPTPLRRTCGSTSPARRRRTMCRSPS